MTTEIRRILCPVDFSDTSINAVRYALRLGQWFGAEVQLLHVVIPEVEALDLPVVAAEATRARVEAARAMITGLLAQERKALGLAAAEAPPTETQIEVGAPEATILEVARRDEASLILMGTRKTHGLLDRLFGSVTEHVLARTERHVWVVPPEAQFAPPNVVAYAAQLAESDPWYIYQTSKLLGPELQTLHVVHAHRPGEKHDLSCEELEAFFAERQQGPRVLCHVVQEADMVGALNDFVKRSEARLLVMWSKHRGLLSRLASGSHTSQLVWRTRVPLLVCRARKH